MPAPNRAGSTSYDLTWADVAAAEEQYAALHQCRIEWRSAWIRYSAKSEKRFLTVYCEAIRGREGGYRVIGVGQCGFRTGRGAASVPAAYLRSMIDACADLEERLQAKSARSLVSAKPPWEE